jgi:phosphate:Na+ symporter
METVDINWWTVGISFFGGLAMFLYGMDRMVDTLKVVAGGRLSTVLRRLTKNPVAGMLTGAGVTAVVQSSSVTTVLTIGFVSAGAMTLPAAIGVVLGANIGTTITGQIVAFNLTTLGFALVAGGYLMRFTSKTVRRRTIGNGFIGLGLLFVGMTAMSAAVECPERTREPVRGFGCRRTVHRDRSIVVSNDRCRHRACWHRDDHS